MRAACLRLGLALGGLGLVGCQGGDAPRWAVQHGSLELTTDGFQGYQVWELFSARWKKDGDERTHLCAVVQRMEGKLTSALDGCEGCQGSYEVTVEPLETDCPEGSVAEGSFESSHILAVGRVPAAIADQDPHPGRSLGWYQGWGEAEAQAMGFVLPEGVGTANDPGVQGWIPGERYDLEPVYAWEL